MNSLTLLIRSVFYYWRTNLAVLLGVIAGTAVIGGALVVGDSVRDSLKEMTLVRLGGIDHVLHSGRFFRESLADDLEASPEFQARFEVATPGLLMQGGFTHTHSESDGKKTLTTRAGGVTIYGVDERFWNITNHGETLSARRRRGDFRLENCRRFAGESGRWSLLVCRTANIDSA